MYNSTLNTSETQAYESPVTNGRYKEAARIAGEQYVLRQHFDAYSTAEVSDVCCSKLEVIQYRRLKYRSKLATRADMRIECAK